jgi:hypothetical protein
MRIKIQTDRSVCKYILWNEMRSAKNRAPLGTNCRQLASNRIKVGVPASGLQEAARKGQQSRNIAALFGVNRGS